MCPCRPRPHLAVRSCYSIIPRSRFWEAHFIHISWIRRTRIDGDNWGVEVPLGEETEAYVLEILSGGSVVRSIACDTPMAVYASADELADFGAPQTSLHVRVAQISSTVGAGHFAEVTLAV
jgi:hypothetical protein